MKRLSILLVLIPSLAFAAGVMKKDKNGVVFPTTAPTVGGEVTSTKADVSLDTSTYSRVRVQPTEAVTAKINGTGVVWPIAADTVQEFSIPASVTSITFQVTSSATACRIRYQAEE
jgi:hypothetical protein